MVLKLVDILVKKRQPNVVEELLSAIRKDRTMPTLHTKLMQMYLTAKEDYKRKHNKREASPPQQRRSYEPYSIAGAIDDDDDQGPLPPPPPNSNQGPRSLHNPPSSSYTSSAQNLMVDQKALRSSISSASTRFSSNPIPGPPPSNYSKKAPFAKFPFADHDPPRPQSESRESGRLGGPISPNPTQSLVIHSQNSYSNGSYADELRDTKSSTDDSDVQPNTPPPLTAVSSKVEFSVQEFSHTAQEGSIMHGSGSGGYSGMKTSLAPVSGSDDPGWSETHQNVVLNKLNTK